MPRPGTTPRTAAEVLSHCRELIPSTDAEETTPSIDADAHAAAREKD